MISRCRYSHLILQCSNYNSRFIITCICIKKQDIRKELKGRFLVVSMFYLITLLCFCHLHCILLCIYSVFYSVFCSVSSSIFLFFYSACRKLLFYNTSSTFSHNSYQRSISIPLFLYNIQYFTLRYPPFY